MLTAPTVRVFVQRKVTVAYITHIRTYVMKGSQFSLFKEIVESV